jgi:hypothetical protein
MTRVTRSTHATTNPTTTTDAELRDELRKFANGILAAKNQRLERLGPTVFMLVDADDSARQKKSAKRIEVAADSPAFTVTDTSPPQLVVKLTLVGRVSNEDQIRIRTMYLRSLGQELGSLGKKLKNDKIADLGQVHIETGGQPRSEKKAEPDKREQVAIDHVEPGRVFSLKKPNS